ncbi:GNAT family N-acetyltransferase [Planococcus sp. MERTA32b]|nr:GNAT family N-acetyltransferase [Planococcus sp. MER TA 32b]
MELRPLREFSTQEIIELWNLEIGNDFPMQEALWEQNTFGDLNLIEEGSVAFTEDGKLAGFIAVKSFQELSEAIMPQDIGWIQCLLVKKEMRGQGLGSRMLKHAEECLGHRGMREIRLGRDPWHYFPGIPVEYEETVQWFKGQGYSRDSIESDLFRRVEGTAPYDLVNSTGHFRVLEQQDLPELLDFLEAAFPGRWHYEALHYLETGASGREFLGLYIEGTLKGFCRINDSASPLIAQNVYWSSLVEGELAGIGPLGIDRTARGKGYGLDLVKAAANELMARGSAAIVIDWTGLTAFYEKLGFAVWKQYTAMSKKTANNRE